MKNRVMSYMRRYQTWLHVHVKTPSRDTLEHGMATAEYAIGTLAAAAFGGILLAVVKSDVIRGAITALIQQALNS